MPSYFLEKLYNLVDENLYLSCPVLSGNMRHHIDVNTVLKDDEEVEIVFETNPGYELFYIGTSVEGGDEEESDNQFSMPAGNVSVVALTVEQGWSFVGTYDTQNFTADDTNIYGFVGTAGTGTNVGTFVRVGGYVRVKPLRAYLQAPSQAQQAPALSTANSETPSTLRVRLLNSNGEPTAIENLEFRIENSDGAWYALDGRKLQGKPTQKGLYINNGRKVAIK